MHHTAVAGDIGRNDRGEFAFNFHGIISLGKTGFMFEVIMNNNT